MERGEVWLAQMPPPRGVRPVLLLSRSSGQPYRLNVTVAPITRIARGAPTEIPVDQTDGLAVPSVVNAEDLITIPKQQLIRRIAKLNDGKLTAVRQAVMYALDFGQESG